MNKPVAKYSKKRVWFIGITYDLAAQARHFQKRIPDRYELVSPSRDDLAKLNINHGFPSNLLMGRDGKILFAIANISFTEADFKTKPLMFETKLNAEPSNLPKMK